MFSDIFLPEVMGTGILILLGCGVVANVILPKTGGLGGGILVINFGWGSASTPVSTSPTSLAPTSTRR